MPNAIVTGGASGIERALCMLLARDGRRVRGRRPHARVTWLTALGRLAEPSAIAEAIAWLLAPKSSYVDRETLTVDGGMMMD